MPSSAASGSLRVDHLTNCHTSRALSRPPTQDDYVDEEAQATFAKLKDDFVAELCEDPAARQIIR